MRRCVGLLRARSKSRHPCPPAGAWMQAPAGLSPKHPACRSGLGALQPSSTARLMTSKATDCRGRDPRQKSRACWRSVMAFRISSQPSPIRGRDRPRNFLFNTAACPGARAFAFTSGSSRRLSCCLLERAASRLSSQASLGAVVKPKKGIALESGARCGPRAADRKTRSLARKSKPLSGLYVLGIFLHAPLPLFFQHPCVIVDSYFNWILHCPPLYCIEPCRALY